MKKTLVITLVLCLLIGLVVGCSSNNETSSEGNQEPISKNTNGEKKAYVMGTDQMGATGYVIGEAIASVVNTHSDKINVATMVTRGGSDNMYLMSIGDIELGNGTSRDWHASVKGGPPFSEPTELYQLFGIAWYNMPLCVAADSDIKSYDDLIGKKVFAGGPSSGSFSIYTDLFNVLGLFDQVEWVDTSWADAYEGLRNGSIDAAALLTLNNMPSASAAQLEEIFEYRVLQLDDPENVISQMNEISGGYVVNTLTPDNFKYVTEDVIFPTTTSVAGCIPGISEDDMYEFVKIVFENLEEIQTLAPDTKTITPELAVSLMVEGVPVHPGAVKYFKEVGIWDESLTED